MGAAITPTDELMTAWAGEDREREQRRRDQLDRENAAIRDRRLEAEAAAKRERAEAVRATAEAQLKARLRADFLRANPAASEQDFLKVYGRLREDHMVREAKEAPERERRALAQRGDYGM